MSAGSFAALNAAYFQKQSMIEAALPGITAAMGNLDINFYYGGASLNIGGNPVNYYQSIKGVLNCWGNFYIPPSAFSDILGFFYNNNSYFPPAISLQGQNDIVAWPGTKGGYFPPTMGPSAAYRTESSCLTYGGTYTLPPPAVFPNYNLYACGAETLYSILRDPRINKACEIYEDSSMAHGIQDSNDDFGTGFTVASDVYKYIAKRAAIFFQAIRTGISLSLGDNVFVDCQNYRYGCTTNYSNTCSANHF